MIFPAPISYLPEVLVTPLSIRHGEGIGNLSYSAAAPTSGVWPEANRAFYYPIYIDRPGLVTKFFTLNGAAAAGNIDIGLYRKDYTRIVSTGAIAQAGTNVLQAYDVTDFWLAHGVYFLGLVNSGTTGTVFRTGLNNALWAGPMGITCQATALPLPATATPVANPFTTPLHVAGFAFRALVA